ncbi:MAG: hypothetical protein NZ750_09115 [Anaerolineae bacterium]|nr:hypothetical protein [Anaerolineae bacterium]MDW8171778.1 hypothetical protein [Anaerolineae bacterium]
MERSIFFEEWRRCLSEQYKAVIRRDDKVTLKTLEPLLERLGFSRGDLRALYIEATMRAEDLPDGFQPQLPSLEAAVPAQPASFQPHPAECTCPACVALVNEAAHDAEGQPLPADGAPPEPPDDERTLFPIVKPNDGRARQLSLF